jgi:hypothetical protein
MTPGGIIVTDQNDSRPGGTKPIAYNEADGIDWGIVKAQARYEELTDRDLYARSRAALEARGEYDPARHGTRTPEPLTVGERLELLANGEVLARYYRHPATLAHAVEAGATWDQIGAARGASAEQARQEYREWAEGQHNLWAGKWGGEPGRCGLDDVGYAEALRRLEPGREATG